MQNFELGEGFRVVSVPLEKEFLDGRPRLACLSKPGSEPNRDVVPVSRARCSPQEPLACGAAAQIGSRDRPETVEADGPAPSPFGRQPETGLQLQTRLGAPLREERCGVGLPIRSRTSGQAADVFRSQRPQFPGCEGNLEEPASLVAGIRKPEKAK